MKKGNKPQLSRISIAILFAMSNQVLADEINSNEPENVVIWGTKVSSSSESIASEDMALKQADHMSDLLRDVPGVDVGGTHSLNQRINIRGLGETDLDIRLDGASQHANMFHHIGNLTLNPDILKSVDIEVGNNSVTQSGLGGSVYFETKSAKELLRGGEKFGARVYGGYASNASQQGSMTAYGLFSDKVDGLFYANLVSTDNFTDGSGTETTGSEGDIYNIMGKLGLQLAPEHRFELAYDFYKDKGDYKPRPDMNGAANDTFSPDTLLPTVYKRSTITLNYKLNADKHTGKATLYTSQTDIERDETGTGWTGRDSFNTAKNNNTGANATFQSDYQLANFNNQVTYGFDYIYQNSASTYGGVDFMDEHTHSAAGFVENKLFLTNNWSLTTGLRADKYIRDAEVGKNEFGEVTWSLGTNWDINKQWSVFANARSLFKGPELLETFIKYQDVAYLADDIKPETGVNSQAGVSFDQRSGDHHYGFNFTAFNTYINDYIDEVWSSDYSTISIENTGDIQIRGFEFSTTYSYKDFSSKLSYSKSDSEYRDTGEPVDNGDGVSADIGDSIALTMDYYAMPYDLLLGWTSIVVLEEDNVFDGDDNKPGYNTHNLYVQWLPSYVPDLSVTFGIDNIFDEYYISHASRSGAARGVTLDDYEPGRNVKLSAAYQF